MTPRYDFVQVNACYTTYHEMERADEGEWVRYEDVAAVIASAPDLLAALKMLLADIEDYQRINLLGGENNHCQVVARAAIARAEGE